MEGATMNSQGDKIFYHGEEFTVIGTERLRILPVAGTCCPPKANDTDRPSVLRAVRTGYGVPGRAPRTDEVCEKCGATYSRSVLHSYITLCPSCRRKPRPVAPGARTLTCPKCGGEFTISKFQPYYQPKACQSCTRAAARARRRERKDQ